MLLQLIKAYSPYEFAEGYKIRDQITNHFLTFSIIEAELIFSAASRYWDMKSKKHLNLQKQSANTAKLRR
jgi:hypothetical protein